MDLQYSGTVIVYSLVVKEISHKMFLLTCSFNASCTIRSVLLHHLVFVDLYEKYSFKLGIDHCPSVFPFSLCEISDYFYLKFCEQIPLILLQVYPLLEQKRL